MSNSLSVRMLPHGICPILQPATLHPDNSFFVPETLCSTGRQQFHVPETLCSMARQQFEVHETLCSSVLQTGSGTHLPAVQMLVQRHMPSTTGTQPINNCAVKVVSALPKPRSMQEDGQCVALSLINGAAITQFIETAVLWSTLKPSISDMKEQRHCCLVLTRGESTCQLGWSAVFENQVIDSLTQ